MTFRSARRPTLACDRQSFHMHIQGLAADWGIAPVLHEGWVGQMLRELRRALGNPPQFIILPSKNVDEKPVDLNNRNVIEKGGDAVTLARRVPVQDILANPLYVPQGPLSGLVQGPQRGGSQGNQTVRRGAKRQYLDC